MGSAHLPSSDRAHRPPRRRATDTRTAAIDVSKITKITRIYGGVYAARQEAVCKTLDDDDTSCALGIYGYAAADAFDSPTLSPLTLFRVEPTTLIGIFMIRNVRF
ncbi:hypothetical protein EVAR_72532_1 [Eumeta japonica]|uniref:Uncharacterized protein n=1 Tax=Eumeta variegata TaxID=151549 RepID=A0A4C1TH04_EUMVA|nr:hypothetical protein EVAR_72532_1 [Eumeta japonica]